MNRAVVFLLVVGVFLLSSAMSGGVQAFSECSETGCVVTVSSALISIILAFGLAIFLPFYPQYENTIDKTSVVGVWRRFGAFYLDFVFVLIIVTPLVAVPLLLAEASYTGMFKWSFEREFSRPDDSSYLFLGIFAGFLALFFYFYLHGRVGRPTIGQYVLGYRVVRATETLGKPQYALRVVFSFIGLCWWPVSLGEFRNEVQF